MTESGTVGEKIRAFILEKFPLARRQGISSDDPLLESGILDSLGILDVVAFLEKEFSLALSDEELIPENFQSLKCLSAFVESKQSSISQSPAK